MTDQPSGGEMRRPVVLCILDGWGNRTETDNNAVALAQTPNWDRLRQQWPCGSLDASGPDVGLPEGQMGNSEVGHLNIGAGRVVLQELPRINKATEDGDLASASALGAHIDALRVSGGTCHLMGLMSPGGVHSHQNHMVALARAVSDAGIPVRVHCFLDGRDTPPQAGLGYLSDFQAALDLAGKARIATLCGRYYAMDRDTRWERVEQAYNALVKGEGKSAQDPGKALERSYADGVGDEFFEPVVLHGYDGMRPGDGLLMANFRADRVRQLLAALVEPAFDGFDRGVPVDFSALTGMISYSEALDQRFGVIFPPSNIADSLGEVLATGWRTQLRLAETEKYAHVTFFFNGGREAQFAGEDRIMVPSPKVATYDLQPEMSAAAVTDHLVEAIGSGKYDFILINYANGDMVGHTGKLDAAIRAVSTLDACLGRVEKAILAVDGTLLVTADHGNCETMVDPRTGGPHTAHTMNPVPTLVVNPPAGIRSIVHGRLADLAPTILELMGVVKPDAMTGKNLLVSDS